MGRDTALAVRGGDKNCSGVSRTNQELSDRNLLKGSAINSIALIGEGIDGADYRRSSRICVIDPIYADAKEPTDEKTEDRLH